jgi:PilZ domain
MSTIDRRTRGERRIVPRYSINLEIEWEANNGRKKGTINDISREGCFVLCSGEVEDGEKVKIFFPLSDGMKVEFLSEVVNHIYEIGFGVRFIELGIAQKSFLSKFIDSLK